MGFLETIKHNLKKSKKTSFRESVEQEKREKYLFSDSTSKKGRVGGGAIFGKKGSSRGSVFSRLFGEKIQVAHAFFARQEFYMKWIGLFLIGSSIYILFYSPYFLLSPSKVLIEGLDDTVDVSIAYRSIEDIYGQNIFLLDEEFIAKTIQSYQKNISSIRIDHLYPNNLKILLSGQPTIFLIQLQGISGKKWGLTENGIMIPEDRIGDLTTLRPLTIIDTSITTDELLDYKELLTRDKVITIQKMLDTFATMWPEIRISNVVYLKKENEVHFLGEKETRIIFTLQDFSQKIGESLDYKYLSVQYLGLKTFIDEHYNDTHNGIYTYIDARIPERIFSCRERAPCTENIKLIYPDIL